MSISNEKKAVIVGGEGTPWPGQNADWVAKSGFDTTVLFFSKPNPGNLPKDVHFISRNINYSLMEKLLLFAWRVLVATATIFSLPLFRKKTGRNPAPCDMPLVDNPVTARKKACIIDELKPDLLIGHNMTLCGQTVAKATQGKKIMIGWGSDFTESYHSSGLYRRLSARVCRKIDLFISGCQTALEMLQKEFSIENHRLLRNTYLDKHTTELIGSGKDPVSLRFELGIPPDAKIVFNSRRFKPVFGGPQGFSACMDVARCRDDVWFIFIEGRNNSKWMQQSRLQLQKLPQEISHRFIIFEGELPYQKIIDIFSISDVFLSLRKRGDMRSATVTQGASLGVVPVLSTYNEWKVIQEKGFEAFLVDPDQSQELVSIIFKALNAPKEDIAQKNRVYLETHESDEIYFERFKTALNKLVEK